MVGRTMLKSSFDVQNITQKNVKVMRTRSSKTIVDENTQVHHVKIKIAEKTKRANGSSPKDAPAKKRSALGDIKNAGNRAVPVGVKKQVTGLIKVTKKEEPKIGVARRTRSQEKVVEKVEEIVTTSNSKSADTSRIENISLSSLLSDAEFGKLSSDEFSSSQESAASSTNTSTIEVNLPDSEKEEKLDDGPIVIPEQKKILPEGVRDVDTDQDPFSVSEYAESIFKNMKAREEMFQVRKYMEGKTQLTPGMRAILIDWLVEVQENFELYHETLYLAVRIVDLFLQEKDIDKTKLQLVGATAMLIASKIEERYPPPLDDFVFICDDAYVASDFIKIELEILRALKFELGIPISYRFLRRFSRVAGVEMEVLTLARYILETSLLHYEFVDCPPSQIAAAALSLSFKMKKCCEWDTTLEYHTGYREEDLKELIIRLNKVISEPPKESLNTVRSKYSHPVFSEVAKIPPITIE